MWHQVEDVKHNAIHIFIDDSLPDRFNLRDYDKYDAIIVVIPYHNFGVIDLFQKEFNLLCADNQYITLFKSLHEVPTPATATRESFALIWDKTHTYIMVEVPTDDKNIFHLPGGHVQHYENSTQGLIREVKEEIGLDITKYPISQFVVIEYQNPEKLKPFDQYQIVFYYDVQTDLDVNATIINAKLDEVSNAHWIRIPDLVGQNMSQPLKMVLHDILKNTGHI